MFYFSCKSMLFLVTAFFFFSSQTQGVIYPPIFLGNETDCFPKEIRLNESEVLVLQANCSRLNFSYLTPDGYNLFLDDEKIATIVNTSAVEVINATNATFPDDAYVLKGRFLGRTVLTILYHSDGVTYKLPEVKVTVIRNPRFIDTLFVIAVTIFMGIAYIGMGCAIDLGVVKEVLKKPVAPIIGFFSQYVIMPLAAFAVVKSFGLSGGIALGFFASGCAPGGGASNMYTYLLGGDSSLSVTMTLISTFASLGMFPLWLNTLGRLVYDTDGVPLRIPFQNIIISLAVMVIPLAMGAVIKIKMPTCAFWLMKMLRIFFCLVIIFMMTAGVYSNLYLFQLISPWLILGACLLSYSGFIFGGLLALVFRLDVSRVIAVAIETGVQNTGLPILLLKFSLPQPDADLSVVSPVSLAMLMPIPLWIAIAVIEIKKKCKKKSAALQTANDPEAKNLKNGEVNGGPNHIVEVHVPEKINLDKVGLHADNAKRLSGSYTHQPDQAGDTGQPRERF